MVNRYLPTPVLHRVTEKDGFVFVGGTACDDTSLDIKGQTREAVAKLDTYLAAAGSDKTKLLFIWVYLKDLGDKEAMNDVMKEWLAPEDMPARATICPGTLGPGMLIELIVTAYK
ncbi:RidA family protein [Martelella alba]|uniref:RidA family protein n=1 Tax=Martelella alba TaxID=2590451 RepID=A0A506U9K4_9HYPH|nr:MULTISPECIES: RidA family protein [Martelella]TPW30036.1 RidA family protein [Martelella alba]